MVVVVCVRWWGGGCAPVGPGNVRRGGGGEVEIRGEAEGKGTDKCICSGNGICDDAAGWPCVLVGGWAGKLQHCMPVFLCTGAAAVPASLCQQQWEQPPRLQPIPRRYCYAPSPALLSRTCASPHTQRIGWHAAAHGLCIKLHSMYGSVCACVCECVCV